MPTDDRDPTLDDASEAVPLKKYNVIYAQLKDAQREIETLKGKATGAGAETQKAMKLLEDTIAERDARIAQMAVDHGFEKAVLSDGIDDPETVEFLRYKYGQVAAPEGAAKPDVSTWYQEYKGTKPSILARFQKEPAPAEKVPEQKPPAASPQPKSPPAVAGVKPPAAPPPAPAPAPKDTSHETRVRTAPPPAAGTLTPQQIANMSKEDRAAYGGLDVILQQVVPSA